ncbi:MAG: hypothetical protein JSV80_16335 [Acidobacteriota bacterium]|nr:MAG: hypothetical protein JSV80_16335 [Acidobacteriota bacterium]
MASHPPQASAARGSEWLIPALVTALAGLVAAVPCARFQPDDLFIYLRVVDNVWSGLGWGFNPHEPINVASSGGWLLWLVALAAGAGASPEAAQLSSGLFMMLGIAGTATLAGRLAGDPRAAWAAGLALAGDAWTMRWLWSGMETGLALSVAVWPFALRVVAVRASRSDRLASGLIALAPVVRPELVLVPIAALAVELPLVRRFGWRRLAGDLAALALIGGAWLAFSSWIWGAVVPATAIAKGTLGASHISSLDAAVRVLAVIGSTQMIAFVAAVLLGAAWAGGTGVLSETAPGRREVVRAILIMAAALVLAYAVQHVRVYTRYVMPVTALLVALGMASLVARARRVSELWAARAWALALAATLAWNLLFASWLVVPRTRAYARSMSEVVFPLAERLARETQPAARIAVPNIGAIGFISRRPIQDLNGLATPEILPYKRRGRVLEYVAAHPSQVLIEIEPAPRTWKSAARRLGMVEQAVYRFEGMFVSASGPMYLTVYRAHEEAHP